MGGLPLGRAECSVEMTGLPTSEGEEKQLGRKTWKKCHSLHGFPVLSGESGGWEGCVSFFVVMVSSDGVEAAARREPCGGLIKDGQFLSIRR